MQILLKYSLIGLTWTCETIRESPLQRNQFSRGKSQGLRASCSRRAAESDTSAEEYSILLVFSSFSASALLILNLTFSNGSAGFSTSSSVSLLNRKSSLGRPSFFSSCHKVIHFPKMLPWDFFHRQEKWFSKWNSTAKPCPAPVYQLASIFWRCSTMLRCLRDKRLSFHFLVLLFCYFAKWCSVS